MDTLVWTDTPLDLLGVKKRLSRKLHWRCPYMCTSKSCGHLRNKYCGNKRHWFLVETIQLWRGVTKTCWLWYHCPFQSNPKQFVLGTCRLDFAATNERQDKSFSEFECQAKKLWPAPFEMVSQGTWNSEMFWVWPGIIITTKTILWYILCWPVVWRRE